MHACAHKRHSPTTRKLIDAASYGWIYRFIHDFGDEAETPPPTGHAWLDTHSADPRKIGEFLGRVAIRLRETPGHLYATELKNYYIELADDRDVRRMSH